MLKLLKANDEYTANISKYTKKDGICALLLFAVIIIEYTVLGILQKHFDFIKNNTRLSGCAANLLIIFITILFVKLNGQKLETTGILKGNWKLSIILGGIFALFYSYNNCLSHIINGSRFVPVKKIPMLTVFFLLVSVCEELVFRGYIGTRIYGFCRNKYITVCATGLLFVVTHFPYRIAAYGMSLSDLTINNWGWLLDLFTFHITLNFVYMKTNSLYGAIIPHWISNLAYNIIAR